MVYCVCGQAMAAAQESRASLVRLEAALSAREAKLADAWKVLRSHAGRLLSEEPGSPEPRLQVSPSAMQSLHITG
jgi:hypothetical protein